MSPGLTGKERASQLRTELFFMNDIQAEMTQKSGEENRQEIRFVSTRGGAPACTFQEAMKQGLAPDGGLYLPDPVPLLPESFWQTLSGRTLQDTGAEMAASWFSDPADRERIREVARDAISFEAPLVRLRENIYVLELFHGPTLAFKDFGARFMARAYARMVQDEEGELLILAATSGDTGSAVAHGFFGVEGTRVILLYPSGKVSNLQEKQMTTLGGNVTALEVDGVFDDCQRLVKAAFSDSGLNKELRLSSANSINIARLIPQSFYYAHALGQLQQQLGSTVKPVFSVPSGNFGNLTAGLLAMKSGMPVSGFLAATNRNDVVPEYLETGEFHPRSSVQTISNAMDVGNPSNFERILHLFEGSLEEIRRHIRGSSWDDRQTRECIRRVWQQEGYLLDPHTAVGVLAAEEFHRESGNAGKPVVVLSTAHPVKFREIVEEETGQEIPVPERLRECLDREKSSRKIGAEYESFRDLLLEITR